MEQLHWLLEDDNLCVHPRYQSWKTKCDHNFQGHSVILELKA